jgi:hypothetical protein
MSSSIQSEGAGTQPRVRLLPEADRRTCSPALIAVRSSERVSLQLTNRIARIGRNRHFRLWNDRFDHRQRRLSFFGPRADPT